MSFSITSIQEDVLDFMRDTVYPDQDVIEQALDDELKVESNTLGQINPYVSLTFGDLQAWGATSFAGPRGDDYTLPLYLRIVAPTPEIARLGSNRAIEKFLGAKFDWAGNIRKRAGGIIFPLKQADGSTQAYIAPVSFGLMVVVALIPDPDPEPEPDEDPEPVVN